MLYRSQLLAVMIAPIALLSMTHPARGERLSNADVTFISFGSVNGEITDCGCKSNPKGGLDFRAGIVDSLRGSNVPFLHVDLGNFTSTTEHTKDALTRFVWEAMEETEVAATTPGPRELQEWDLFQELREGSPVRVVSTNLTYLDAGQEKPVGDRHVVVVRNGVSIGLIGLIGEQAFSSAGLSGVDIRMSDPSAAAQRAVEEIRDQVDLVVLLSELSKAELQTVLNQVPDIDVALAGYMPPFLEEAEQLGKTVVQQTGTRGQFLGSLTVIVDPKGELIDHGTHNVTMWDPLPRNAKMTERVEALVALNAETVAKARASATPAGD